MAAIELGLGLISLGREWATRKAPLPTTEEACSLLRTAVGLGIRFYDTAPSYGASEEKLGVFLRTLSGLERSKLLIATKCGEDWIEETQSTRVDHSYDTLCRSIDRSLERLGRVDLLQIHKATASVVNYEGVLKALEYARSRGVTAFGASVKDLEAARSALANPVFSYLQFPYNLENQNLAVVFELAAVSGTTLIINRPFAMGALLSPGQAGLTSAIRFLLDRPFTGILLMGTASEQHLRENVAAFRSLVDPPYPTG